MRAALGFVMLFAACGSSAPPAAAVPAPVAAAPAPVAVDAEPEATLSAACDRGDGARCLALGERTTDPVRAGAAYQHGCTAGNDGACLKLATVEITGRGMAQDIAGGIALEDRLCTKHFVDACTNLASAYLSGAFVARDLVRGARLLRAACDGGDDLGCNTLQTLIVQHVLPDDAGGALEVCEDARPARCTLLGARYFSGTGVAVDRPRARELFDRACAAHYANACMLLGVSFAVDPGGADYAHAADAFRRGCDAGGALACNELAVLYLGGKGVASDAATARLLYVKACEGGAIASCSNAAAMMVTGDGGSKDPVLAAKYMENACTGGSSDACNDLGVFYARGTGVARDRPRAATYFDAACQGGDASGCRNAKVLVQCAQGSAEACAAFDRDPKLVSP